MDEPSLEAIHDAIGRYLSTHPAAADTAKGIATCWLAFEHTAATKERLVAVLEVMAARRELVARKLPDGETLYERGPRLGAVR